MTNIKNVEHPSNLENLLQQTNEVLVQNFEQQVQQGTHKPFNIVNLWNLEKKQKTAHLSSRFLN